MKVHKDERDHKWYVLIKWKGYSELTEETYAHLKKPGNCTADILRDVEKWRRSSDGSSLTCLVLPLTASTMDAAAMADRHEVCGQ